jgi:hypothetical protein
MFPSEIFFLKSPTCTFSENPEPAPLQLLSEIPNLRSLQVRDPYLNKLFKQYLLKSPKLCAHATKFNPPHPILFRKKGVTFHRAIKGHYGKADPADRR